MKKVFYTCAGCLFIALAFNLFFLPYNLVSTGVLGWGLLINYHNNYDPAIFILIVNAALLVVALIGLGPKKTSEYVFPSLMTPLLIFITYDINEYIQFDNLETVLATITGAFLTALGYSLLYKEGKAVGGVEILQDLFNSIKEYRTKYLTYSIEAAILILAYFILDVESVLYSLIAMVVIRTIATKSKLGVSSSKTFFIITTKEKEVRDYIMNVLNHDITEFNVKGGFTHAKCRILMTAMDTRDYFKLKEAILDIDSKAFISITDSYEVINKNITLKKQKRIK